MKTEITNAFKQPIMDIDKSITHLQNIAASSLDDMAKAQMLVNSAMAMLVKTNALINIIGIEAGKYADAPFNADVMGDFDDLGGSFDDITSAIKIAGIEDVDEPYTNPNQEHSTLNHEQQEI